VTKLAKQAVLMLFLSQGLAKTSTFKAFLRRFFAREMLAVLAMLHRPGAM
jgi:hypothetical protein